MNFALFASVLLLVGTVAAAGKHSYQNYRLIRLELEEKHADLLETWEGEPDFDLWAHSRKASNYSATVFLSPVSFLKYKQLFNLNGLDYEVINNNFQTVIEEEQRSIDDLAKTQPRNIVGTFARHNDINAFIDSLVAANPSFVQSYIAGQTYEKRNMKVIQIKTKTAQKAVWIDCGIHAREWISPSTCVFMMDTLISQYKEGVKAIVDLLNYYEVHILPVHNPDGYEFAHTNTRLWRKNRAPNAVSSCIGTDLNRNYGHQWSTGGSSNNPCSDTYAGSKRDSELETQAVEKAILAKKGQWDAFLTIHTYGLWWFTVWGYTTSLASNHNELMSVSKPGVDAFKATNGLTLTHGSSAQILYIASGGSEDWATAEAGIKYSYCLELRPGQTGVDSSYGFTLPVDRALPAGRETYNGVVAFFNNIRTLAGK